MEGRRGVPNAAMTPLAPARTILLWVLPLGMLREVSRAAIPKNSRSSGLVAHDPFASLVIPLRPSVPSAPLR